MNFEFIILKTSNVKPLDMGKIVVITLFQR